PGRQSEGTRRLRSPARSRTHPTGDAPTTPICSALRTVPPCLPSFIPNSLISKTEREQQLERQRLRHMRVQYILVALDEQEEAGPCPILPLSPLDLMLS